jgi:divalent metal cation (Fe/Co/Zn/Cd) transporter
VFSNECRAGEFSEIVRRDARAGVDRRNQACGSRRLGKLISLQEHVDLHLEVDPNLTAHRAHGMDTIRREPS